MRRTTFVPGTPHSPGAGSVECEVWRRALHCAPMLDRGRIECSAVFGG